jgi:hypothetical protein
MPEKVQITTTDAEIDAAIRLARQFDFKMWCDGLF